MKTSLAASNSVFLFDLLAIKLNYDIPFLLRNYTDVVNSKVPAAPAYP